MLGQSFCEKTSSCLMLVGLCLTGRMETCDDDSCGAMKVSLMKVWMRSSERSLLAATRDVMLFRWATNEEN